MAGYSEYKDSGQQWLGMIPSHWEMVKIRGVLDENTNQNFAHQVSKQLQFKVGTIIPKKLNYDAEDADWNVIEKYVIVRPNDIVINGLNLNYDLLSMRVGLVKEKGIITSAYIIMRPKEGFNPAYLNYAFKGWDSRKLFHGMGTGVRITLSWKELKNYSIPIPPKEEQEAIVEYLDKVTADIDKSIAAKEQIIASLEERRKIIITHAVTRGVNSDVPMRDSGIDWLGAIPAHWDVLPIKRVANLILGKMLDNTGGSSTSAFYPYICAKDVHFEGINTSDLKRMYFTDSEIKRYKVQNGDLLVVEGGAGAGGCSIVKDITGLIGVQNSIIIVRTFEGCVNEFLSSGLQSFVKRGYIEFACNKATIPHFTKDKLGSVMIGVPSKEEQYQIVEFIESALSPIDSAIAQQRNLIELLRERKNIIINETVTGKVKVI